MRLAPKSPCFKSKFITAELAHVFSQSDSDDEEFVGFSNEEGKRTITSVNDSDMDTGFYSDGEEEACAPKRKSLCVALRFPTKRLPTLKQQLLSEKKVKRPFTTAPPSMRTSQRAKQQQQKKDVAGGEDRAPSVGQLKRDKNIEENKAMLAKLFAELDAMADLTPLNTPQKRRTSEKIAPRKRRLELESGSERRNPSRKARPPENFGVEKNDHSPERRCHVPRTVLIRKLLKVDRKHVAGHGKKGMSRRVRKIRYVVRSVEEITKEELDNICYRTKDKIYDKDTGSSCHQCRQKTLDTKTVCRSGFCVGVKGQFCGPCLKNRYGEDVRTVLLDPMWSCPLCRGMCNCSLCRRSEGRCATGTMVGLARYNGHDNVHEYLASIQKGL